MQFVLSRPWLLWSLTGVFAVRVAILSILAPSHGDGRALLAAGGAFLHHPQALYSGSAAALGRTGLLPVHGWLGPPAGALLAAPFSLLPSPFDLAAWIAGDALAALVGLGFVYAALRPRGWTRPAFWLVAAYFPPLFADVDGGQMGGYLLLLSGACLWACRRRPALAGALAGLAAGIKLYPGAILLGSGPRLRRLGPALVLAAAGINLAGFLRPGMVDPFGYVKGVLLPALHSSYPDCAIDSVPTLYQRTVGGVAYPLPGQHGLIWVRLPLHLPQLAAVLTALTILALAAATVWAAWRSGWHPLYGPALALSLGALIPGEVNTYMFLPLLPVVLVTGVRAAERGRGLVLLAIGVALAGFARQPCYLPFPNLWTLAALALFAICACQNGLFRDTDGDPDGPPVPAGSAAGRRMDGTQRSAQFHVDRARNLEGAQRTGQADPSRRLGDEQPGRSRPPEADRPAGPDADQSWPLRPHP